MRKFAYLIALTASFILASCSNDDIPVEKKTVVRVNPSTIMTPFSYQISPGDLDGVDATQNVRIRLFVYDENGDLYTSEQQDVKNYLTSAAFNLNLDNEKNYTVIAISDVTDTNDGSVAEYWTVSDQKDINTLKITYAGSDTNYGDQEILGVSSATVSSGDNATINLQAAGALVCTHVSNIHAYSNIEKILIWGSRGNGFFDFESNGTLNSNPDLDILPDFLDIDVPNTSYSGIYSYKFLMPQTNYELALRFFDGNGESLGTGFKEGLRLEKGREYLFYVELDPNGLGDNTYSSDFVDVTNKQANAPAARGAANAGSIKTVIECKSASTSKNNTSYKVKDLL